MLTKDFIADIMLLDKIPEQLFIGTISVCDLNRHMRPGQSSAPSISHMVLLLTAVSQNVQPSSIAFVRTGSASSRLKLVPIAELRPIAPNPGT